MARLFIRNLCLTAAILISVAGCSATHYRQETEKNVQQIIATKQAEALGQTEPFSIDRPSAILRTRLLIGQNLPQAGPASLGSGHLPAIPHWPEPTAPFPPLPAGQAEEISLSLAEALQVAALNSREYQNRKEELFRSALTLDLERETFRGQPAGALSGEYAQDRSSGESGSRVEGSSGTLSGGLTKLFASGVSLTTQIGWDLIRMLQPGREFSSGLYGDASITVPLLRGAGRHIVAEPLTQAERNMLYAVRDFERYKKKFAVDLVDSYLQALQAEDLLRNQEENYRGLITSSRRAVRLAEAGKLPQIQVDQSIQNELSARDRWVAARQSRERILDGFKIQLGLPTDALVTLDREEFNRLEADLKKRLTTLFTLVPAPAPTTADAPIRLEPPDPQQAGPLELPYAAAIDLALSNRLDLRIEKERVEDAQRQVVVAADALRPELTLFGSVSTGTRRSIAALQPDNNNRLELDKGVYQSLLTLDLPLERTAEAIAYRDSFIALERAVRSVQELEDRIKLEVRNGLRDLEQARASLKIQNQAVELAKRRVRGAELQFQAGRAEMRDLLDARESLLIARNALTAAQVDYRLAELALQRDLGVLQVDHQGGWHEFNPDEATE